MSKEMSVKNGLCSTVITRRALVIIVRTMKQAQTVEWANKKLNTKGHHVSWHNEKGASAVFELPSTP